MYVNNHIHTTYSFSPYSPAEAVAKAAEAGLKTAGIMDHDSISGAQEFIAAGERIGIATTIGVECRVKVTGTRLAGRRINSPDQKSIMYIALHAIPHRHINTVIDFFKPLCEQRNIRNRAMVDNVNRLLTGVSLDFDKDVYPLSMAESGGSITERHIMYALAKKLTATGDVLDELENIGIEVSGKNRDYLTDKENPYLEYDLVGVLKGSLIPKVYVDATDECPEVSELIAFGKDINAITAYAYLGDVTSSITGDKLAQTFEDDYIELLFEELNRLGFHAVTYMPSRNTIQQLMRVRSLCDKYGFMQISGEDINSPRQSFICEALNNPMFQNLIDATWELIRHEREG